MDPSRLLARRVVVVADDEQFSRSIIMRMVRDLGCEHSFQSVNGQEALEAIKQLGRKLSLLIADFNMPVLNGLQLLKLIRTGQAGVPHDLPVIMLTGHADSGLVGAAMALDVDAFVIKPVSKQMLATRLTKVLGEGSEVKLPDQYGEIDIESVSSRMLKNDPVGLARPTGPAIKKAVRLKGVRMKLDDVAEGALLAEEVRAPDGELLLGIGVRLNARYLRRLKELSGVIQVEYLMVEPPGASK